MIKAVYKDKHVAIEILARSFDDNKSVNYVVKQDKKRLERIRSLMEYSFEMCFLYGEVFLSDDKKGCALILYPHDKKSTIRTTYLDIKLVLGVGISKVLKISDRESKIKSYHPNKPFIHL